ncbi:MAG: 2-C-methyl-D-erythritol 4-phosphate cytidylyltransferase, partial [Lachnospiraceae bacterium]|nr:2-C-methyl-D-erythritol 4-phosphate cytidylyltransferase [Lachnospiraceae bacterium]
EWREKIYEQMPEAALKKLSGFSKPGPNRQRSVFNGLQTIMPSAEKSDIIVIHDATRPLVSKVLISACVKACEKHDGGIPVLPVLDTIYMRKDRCVDSFHERGTVYTQQTPEAYRLKKYYAANKKLLPDKLDQINDSAEPAVLAGMKLTMFLGEVTNFRIETLIDLERLKLFISI